MRPAQIVNPRVHNLEVWEQPVELAVVVEIALGIMATIPPLQTLGQVGDDALAVFGALVAGLDLLGDAPPDFPKRHQGDLVNRGIGRTNALVDDARHIHAEGL